MRSHLLPTPFLPSLLLRDCSLLLERGCSLLNKGTKLGLNPCRICITSCSCFPQQTPLCPQAVTPSNSLAEAASSPRLPWDQPKLQHSKNKQGKTLCHAPGARSYWQAHSAFTGSFSRSWGVWISPEGTTELETHFFFFFHFKISSCFLSSFGQCQAFLVLCPPICSPGLQRGQGSGWGVMFIKWQTWLRQDGKINTILARGNEPRSNGRAHCQGRKRCSLQGLKDVTGLYMEERLGSLKQNSSPQRDLRALSRA